MWFYLYLYDSCLCILMNAEQPTLVGCWRPSLEHTNLRASPSSSLCPLLLKKTRSVCFAVIVMAFANTSLSILYIIAQHTPLLSHFIPPHPYTSANYLPRHIINNHIYTHKCFSSLSSTTHSIKSAPRSFLFSFLWRKRSKIVETLGRNILPVLEFIWFSLNYQMGIKVFYN